MKKCLSILVSLMLAMTLCFSTASAQLMMVDDSESGNVINVYNLPSRSASIIGRVAAGALVDAVEATADRSWFRITAGGDSFWIPATVLNAVRPSQLYWFSLLDENIELPATGTVDVYRSRLDPVAMMLIQTIPDKTAEETIAAIKERFPGGTDLPGKLGGRDAAGYETVSGRIRKSNYALTLNGGDTMLIEVVTGSDPEDASRTLFNAALDDIHFADILSEVEMTNRVFCPRCSIWFDSPESYAAHKCPAAAKKTTHYIQCPNCGNWYAEGSAYNNHTCRARSPEYVQCPDCGNWYEEGNVFRNHVCPAKNYSYVQCPDCGEWFEEGVIFRNHVCPGRDEGETPEMVRCPDCGDWFEEGVIFRNHVCPAKLANMVQCPDCLDWFEEGNIFRNHDCPAKRENMVQCPDCFDWFEEGTIFRNHNCPARSHEQEQETTSDDKVSLQCEWCKEWFEDMDVYIHHISYDCPMRDVYDGDDPIDSPEDPVEEGPQDPGAEDFTEPVEEGPQDPGADDSPEPVEEGPQDPGAEDFPEPVEEGPQDTGADDYPEPVEEGPQDTGADDFPEPVEEGPQDTGADDYPEPVEEGPQDPEAV